MSPRLTHFDKDGKAVMVDVSGKDVTSRIAVAASKVTMNADALKAVREGDAKKGDVLGVARIAGIMAAKRTADLIPLCHQLPLSKVVIDFELLDDGVAITASVKTNAQTGVEMEALTAASITALTIYDMLKAVDRGMVIGDTRLLLKDGGKSGRYEAQK